MPEQEALLTLTADIVAAHVSNNSVALSDVPTLVQRVHEALAGLGAAPQPEGPAKPEPVVSVRSSVKPDAITCLIDGTKHKMLKRHLARAHGLTPAEYREQFGLREDYPMTAPNYAEMRRALAHKMGLGKKGRGNRSKAAANRNGSAGAGNGRRGRRSAD